jgi:hypothetical protein
LPQQAGKQQITDDGYHHSPAATGALWHSRPGCVPSRRDTPVLRHYEKLRLWQKGRRQHSRDEFTRPREIAGVFASLVSHAASCSNGSNGYAADGFLNFKYDLKVQG